MLDKTIEDCVLATKQTYVETLKKNGEFDEAAQKEAFEKTKEAILNILNEDAKEYLNKAYGDLNTYITQKIESEVNLTK
jgi:transcriptional regulator